MADWRNIKTFESFGSGPFRIYFLSMFWQWIGQNIQGIAQSLLIYRLTGSTAILGLMVLISAVPQLLFSLFAGVLADRFPKKRLIQAGQGFQGLVFAGVGFALMSGYLSSDNSGSWWIIIASAAVQAVLFSFTSPAISAIYPELVGKEKVMNAMSLNSIGSSVVSLIAPAVGGVLIDAIDFKAVYFIVGGLYLLSAVIVHFIPAGNARSVSKRNAVGDVIEGLKYAWKNKTILYIIMFTFACVIVVQPQITLTPVYSENILKVGATGLGLLQSAGGAGILLAAIVMASLPAKKRGIIMLASGIGLGITLTVFAFSRSWPLSLAMMAIIGAGKIGHMTVGTTLIQTNSEAAYLGRTLSIMQISMGLGGLSSFIVSALAEKIGVEWAIGGFALALIPISALMIILLPKVRKLD